MNISTEKMKYCIMFAWSCFSIYAFCAMSSTAKRLYKKSQRAIRLFLMQIAWSWNSWVERTLTFWVKKFAKFINSFKTFKNWSIIIFSICVSWKFSSVTEKFKKLYRAFRSNWMCIMMLCCLRFWVNWALETSRSLWWLHQWKDLTQVLLHWTSCKMILKLFFNEIVYFFYSEYTRFFSVSVDEQTREWNCASQRMKDLTWNSLKCIQQW